MTKRIVWETWMKTWRRGKYLGAGIDSYFLNTICSREKVFYRNVSSRYVAGRDARAHTHTHIHTHTHTDYTAYNCISICRELQYGRKYLRKAEIHVSIFSVPFSLLWSCLPFLFLYLGHPVVFGDTGIASYFPEGRWVNFRSRSRDHGACRSKCTSAIFGAGREVADRITALRRGGGGGEREKIVPTYPNFHKVQDMKGFLGKYHRWSNAFLLRRSERDCPRC